jgi:hypothetical protein
LLKQLQAGAEEQPAIAEWNSASTVLNLDIADARGYMVSAAAAASNSDAGVRCKELVKAREGFWNWQTVIYEDLVGKKSGTSVKRIALANMVVVRSNICYRLYSLPSLLVHLPQSRSGMNLSP